MALQGLQRDRPGGQDGIVEPAQGEILPEGPRRALAELGELQLADLVPRANWKWWPGTASWRLSGIISHFGRTSGR